MPPNHFSSLIEPSDGIYPIPARCFDGIKCEHKGECPKIWVRQGFLVNPKIYSDYWSLAKDDLGRFIVKSSHAYGEWDSTAYAVQEYRTFIWRVTDVTAAMEENPEETLWLAVWVD